MFLPKNYYQKVAAVDFSVLPEALRKGHEYVGKATEEGRNWDNYHKSDSIKRVIDVYFDKLASVLVAQKKKKESSPKVKTVKKTKATKKTVPPEGNVITTDKHMVSRTSEELRFIRRFINLNGKMQTREQILQFVNSLQKAIVEKRIRKTSAWAEQVRYIQDRLLDTYNSMKAKVTLVFKPETVELFKQFVSSEKLLPSVAFIKRYISMHEKPGVKVKATALLKQIDNAYEKGIIGTDDPYYHELSAIKKHLYDFVSASSIKAMKIEMQTLKGLQGILSGCNCPRSGLDGVEALPQVMNSMDFANVKFSSIGLQGKWRDFIGDPSPGFTAMVFGKPKYGKSSLCVDFAGYLARNHGQVLYVAKEEGLNRTLQDKLDRVKHPNLTISSTLPLDLEPFTYIFLDSVTRLGLTPEDLRRLKAANPSKSFIYVFQVTKNGMFRGGNDFQHDVDIVVDVPQIGKAVQFGRYNQGGEMDIFDRAA